jgi:hypothetical protein
VYYGIDYVKPYWLRHWLYIISMQDEPRSHYAMYGSG